METLMSQSKLTVEETIASRHAVRQFQKGYPLPDAELRRMLELAGMAPSAWNLQHWRFLVIREEANKQKLLPLAYGQQQVVDASAVIVVLGDLEANKVAAEVFAAAPEEVRNSMVGQIESAYAARPQMARDEAIRNASLAAMQLMLAAKAFGYDTTPMGGYDASGVVREFNIPGRYIPVLMIALGKAAAPARPTERFAVERLAIHERFE